MTDISKQQFVNIDVALSEIEGTIRNPLDVGFRHGPLTIKEYQAYEERCRWAASVIRKTIEGL